MFGDIASAADADAVAKVLRSYLAGPARDEAIVFLAAYLSRTVAGFVPDPQQLIAHLSAKGHGNG